MKTIEALIVEDNPENQLFLSYLLGKHCPSVHVIGVVATVKDAIQNISDLSPDLVFLDVELSDGSGFDVLTYFQPLPFKVIFVTGHLDYAYQVIKFNAVDFLFKPVTAPDLIEAVKRVSQKELTEAYQERPEGARLQFENPSRLILREVSGFTIIETSEIIKLEASGNYTDVYLTGMRKHTYCRILKEFVKLLEAHPNFMRVHKSFFINLDHVISYSKQGEIKLIENLTAQVGDTFKKKFLAHFA